MTRSNSRTILAYIIGSATIAISGLFAPLTAADVTVTAVGEIVEDVAQSEIEFIDLEGNSLPVNVGVPDVKGNVSITITTESTEHIAGGVITVRPTDGGSTAPAYSLAFPIDWQGEQLILQDKIKLVDHVITKVIVHPEDVYDLLYSDIEFVEPDGTVRTATLTGSRAKGYELLIESPLDQILSGELRGTPTEGSNLTAPWTAPIKDWGGGIPLHLDLGAGHIKPQMLYGGLRLPQPPLLTLGSTSGACHITDGQFELQSAWHLSPELQAEIHRITNAVGQRSKTGARDSHDAATDSQDSSLTNTVTQTANQNEIAPDESDTADSDSVGDASSTQKIFRAFQFEYQYSNFRHYNEIIEEAIRNGVYDPVTRDGAETFGTALQYFGPNKFDLELDYELPYINSDNQTEITIEYQPTAGLNTPELLYPSANHALPFDAANSKNQDLSTQLPLSFAPDQNSFKIRGSAWGLDIDSIDTDYPITDKLTLKIGYDLSADHPVNEAFTSNWVDDYRFFNFGYEFQTRNWADYRLSYYDGGTDTNFGENVAFSYDPFGPRRIARNGEPLNMKIDSETRIGEDMFTTLYADPRDSLLDAIDSKAQMDFCRSKQVPTDPHYQQKGIHDGNSWGERFDDQWAIKRVGFTNGRNSAWNEVSGNVKEIVVAVIDSGLDWDHADIDHTNLWRNSDEVMGNGIDDDRNGYIDDIIGWDFINRSNKPWDHDGHGTMVAGIIGASHNQSGIAGINPHVKLMIVRALDNEGRSRASLIAKGIVYAADNGAQIINLSVGGEHLSIMEEAAIEYAAQKGALIIVASGNDGKQLDDYALADYENVLTVGATYLDDQVAAFSNKGPQVDIVAPGVDVLSLRARMTDTNYSTNQEGADYPLGKFVVGDQRYIKASGTSFAAPIVAGVASLVWATNPQYTAAQVKAALQNSADDIGQPGRDDETGHGLVNARTALTLPADFSIDVVIDTLNVVQEKKVDEYQLIGTANANTFKRAWISIGEGEKPTSWQRVGTKLKHPVVNGLITTIPSTEFSATGVWQIALHVEHENGVVRSYRKPLRLR